MGQEGLPSGVDRTRAENEERELLTLAQDIAPDYARYWQRMTEIEGEIRKISGNLAADNITEQEAVDALTPLVVERQQIAANPDYIVSQLVFESYLKKPAIQARLRKASRVAAGRPAPVNSKPPAKLKLLPLPAMPWMDDYLKKFRNNQPPK